MMASKHLFMVTTTLLTGMSVYVASWCDNRFRSYTYYFLMVLITSVSLSISNQNKELPYLAQG